MPGCSFSASQFFHSFSSSSSVSSSSASAREKSIKRLIPAASSASASASTGAALLWLGRTRRRGSSSSTALGNGRGLMLLDGDGEKAGSTKAGVSLGSSQVSSWTDRPTCAAWPTGSERPRPIGFVWSGGAEGSHPPSFGEGWTLGMFNGKGGIGEAWLGEDWLAGVAATGVAGPLRRSASTRRIIHPPPKSSSRPVKIPNSQLLQLISGLSVCGGRVSANVAGVDPKAEERLRRLTSRIARLGSPLCWKKAIASATAVWGSAKDCIRARAVLGSWPPDATYASAVAAMK